MYYDYDYIPSNKKLAIIYTTVRNEKLSEIYFFFFQIIKFFFRSKNYIPWCTDAVEIQKLFFVIIFFLIFLLGTGL